MLFEDNVFRNWIIVNSIYDAVLSGRITEERIDQSVKKIWKMKMELGILENSNINWTAIEDNVGLSENKATSQFIANRSITLVKNDKNLVPLKPSKLKKITHLILTTDEGGNRTLAGFSKDLSRTHSRVEKILIDYKLNNKRINNII